MCTFVDRKFEFYDVALNIVSFRMLLKWTFLAPILGQTTERVYPVLEAQIFEPVVAVDAAPFTGDIESRFLGQPIGVADSHSFPRQATAREKAVVIGILVVLMIAFGVVGLASALE